MQKVIFNKKKITALNYIFSAFLFMLLLGSCATSSTKTKKAIFIIVDGIPADVIEKLDPPNLNVIAKQGGFAKAMVGGRKDYSQSPTISAVGYNSVLTGTWANKHNVWDNDIKAPNYNLLKTQSPEKKIGIFSS